MCSAKIKSCVLGRKASAYLVLSGLVLDASPSCNYGFASKILLAVHLTQVEAGEVLQHICWIPFGSLRGAPVVVPVGYFYIFQALGPAVVST